jgi:hypothetical protein
MPTPDELMPEITMAEVLAIAAPTSDEDEDD